jgi:hypothetical protein
LLLLVVTLGEVVIGGESERDRLKRLSTTRSLTTWHDHSEITGEMRIIRITDLKMKMHFEVH